MTNNNNLGVCLGSMLSGLFFTLNMPDINNTTHSNKQAFWYVDYKCQRTDIALYVDDIGDIITKEKSTREEVYWYVEQKWFTILITYYLTT